MADVSDTLRPLTRLYPARVTSPTTLIGAWPAPPALPPPTHGTPSLPRLVSACSIAETASLLATASRSAMLSASWFQPICPPAMSRSEEHTSELQSLMRISYAVFCLKKKKYTHKHQDS